MKLTETLPSASILAMLGGLLPSPQESNVTFRLPLPPRCMRAPIKLTGGGGYLPTLPSRQLEWTQWYIYVVVGPAGFRSDRAGFIASLTVAPHHIFIVLSGIIIVFGILASLRGVS